MDISKIEVQFDLNQEQFEEHIVPYFDKFADKYIELNGTGGKSKEKRKQEIVDTLKKNIEKVKINSKICISRGASAAFAPAQEISGLAAALTGENIGMAKATLHLSSIKHLNEATLFHEFNHAFVGIGGFIQQGAKGESNRAFNEGVTEMMATKMAGTKANAYLEEVAFANLTSIIIGQDKLANAYEQGDINQVFDAIEKELGTSQNFKQAIEHLDSCLKHQAGINSAAARICLSQEEWNDMRVMREFVIQEQQKLDFATAQLQKDKATKKPTKASKIALKATKKDLSNAENRLASKMEEYFKRYEAIVSKKHSKSEFKEYNKTFLMNLKGISMQYSQAISVISQDFHKAIDKIKTQQQVQIWQQRIEDIKQALLQVGTENSIVNAEISSWEDRLNRVKYIDINRPLAATEKDLTNNEIRSNLTELELTLPSERVSQITGKTVNLPKIKR